MSLISIAQGETFHISFEQSANKGYEADPLASESFHDLRNADIHFARAGFLCDICMIDKM